MAQPQGLRGGGLLDTNMWGSENDTHGMNTTFHIETEENLRHIIFPLQRRPDITPSVWIGLQPLASRRCWQTLVHQHPTKRLVYSKVSSSTGFKEPSLHPHSTCAAVTQ